MRVGVYAGDFGPEEGGGHGFVAAVLEAFLAAAGASRHQFTLLCEPGGGAALAARCRTAGVALRTLPARGAFTVGLESLRCHAPVSYLLRRWPGRLDALGAREGLECLWFVPGIAYEATDIPYIGTVWDLLHRQQPWFPEASAGGMWEHRELVYARFVRRAAHLLTGTQAGSRQLQLHYQVPPERVSVLPQPAPLPSDFPEAPPSAAIAGLAQHAYFLYPAQFWAHKNHVNLLHALQQLGGQTRLALPGADKGNLAHVRRVARDLGLESRVAFPGFVSRSDLGWLYRHALALVYPSFLGPDNLPPLEAFALGCPVAMSDYEGAAEQAGDAALRFDPRSPESISQALRTLADDRDQRERLARLGRERAARWSAADYAQGVLAQLDRFEELRRCWPQAPAAPPA